MKIILILPILTLIVYCSTMADGNEMTMSTNMNKRIRNGIMMKKREFESNKPQMTSVETSQSVKRHSHEAFFLSKRDTMNPLQKSQRIKRNNHESFFLSKRNTMNHDPSNLMFVRRDNH